MLHGGQSRLHGIDHIGCLCQRLRGLVDVLEKGLDSAYRQCPVNQKFSGQNGNQHLPRPVYKADGRIDGLGQKFCLDGGSGKLLRSLLHRRKTFLLPVKCPDDHAPAVGLLHTAGQPAHGPLPSGREAERLS